MSENPNQTPNQPRTFFEEVSVQGNQLIEQVEKLIKEGNVRKLILRDGNDRTLIEIPLTLGVVAGAGITALAGWPLAVIGVVAGYLAKIHIIVERYEDPTDADREVPTVIEVKKTE